MLDNLILIAQIKEFKKNTKKSKIIYENNN